ncbi:hypothetical protein JEQ01_03110 [Serratia marcescens]|nr:hypothetical protein [Serratia marcescens]
MDNKLSELSKPVDIRNWKMDSWREAPCNGTEWAKGYFDGWNKYHSKVEENLPLYSQEYVSALDGVAQYWIGESAGWKKRAKDAEKRIAELERILDGVTPVMIAGGWTAKGISDYAKSLESKLATPVRLPNKNDDEFWFDNVFQVAKFDRAVERAIRTAGLTVGEE